MYVIHPLDLAELLGDGYQNEQQRSEASFAQHAGWDEKEEDCACNGTGWCLSNLDQWHRCPYHGAGKPHPEDDLLDEAEEAWRGVALGLEAGKAEAVEVAKEDDSDDVPF